MNKIDGRNPYFVKLNILEADFILALNIQVKVSTNTKRNKNEMIK